MAKKSPKILKKDVAPYIDLREIFPRSKPDFKTGLSKYQAGKIKKALDVVKNYGGGKLNDFVPMGKGRTAYMAQAALPPYMKGIFLSGGQKHNSKLKYEEGEIKYLRGNSTRSRTELDTASEESIIISAKKILKNRKGRKAAVTADGRVIGGAQNIRNNDTLIREAVYIFNKYAEMAENKEMRIHNGSQIMAAHPSVWGMGILFEGKENGTKKQTIKKSRRK